MFVCLCVCDSSEAIEDVIVKRGIVVAADTRMLSHVVLTLTFIQGHKDLNHETNKSLIISETV